MLKLTGITHSFGENNVLNQFSLTLRPGQRIALMGPSGVGKTTVLRLAMGLLTPDEGAEVVSRMESITHEKLDCSLYIYENAGKRFAADGYLFPNSIRTHGKKEQLNNVLNWVSGGKMPVKTPETIKLVPSVMGNAGGDLTIMLTNASLDNTGIFRCLVRTDRDVFLMNDDGTLTAPKQEKCADGVLATIPSIDAWDYVLLTNIK